MKDYEALARRVRDRRTQLGLRQDEIDGVSRATIERIEAASGLGFRDLTLRRLEQGLKWPHQTVDAILAGDPDPSAVPGAIEERLTRIETLLEALCNHFGIGEDGLRTA